MATGGYRGTGTVAADPVPPPLPGPGSRTVYCLAVAGDGLSSFFLTMVGPPGECSLFEDVDLVVRAELLELVDSVSEVLAFFCFSHASFWRRRARSPYVSPFVLVGLALFFPLSCLLTRRRCIPFHGPS